MKYTDDWDREEHFYSRAEKKTDILNFGDIGGVGQLVYHNFRFADYRQEWREGDTLIIPVLDEDAPLDAVPDEKLDGNRILTGLYDLAKKIDSFETKENYIDLIIQWCREYMQPYNLEMLYVLLISDERVDDPFLMSKTAMQDGTFSVNRFMKDLGYLYNAVRVKKALDGIAIAEEEDAYNLYEIGRFFEAPSFFESYKIPRTEKPDDLIPESLKDEEDGLLRSMKIQSEYEKTHQPERPPCDTFAYEPFDDYEEVREKLMDLFPDFKFRLKTNPADGRVVLAAVVDSVFDIAWYALAHLMTEEPMLKDLGTRETNLKGIMATCKNCGRLFIRYNSRNNYCEREECQKARNAKNQREFRKRRAEQKARA